MVIVRLLSPVAIVLAYGHGYIALPKALPDFILKRVTSPLGDRGVRGAIEFECYIIYTSNYLSSVFYIVLACDHCFIVMLFC